MFLLLALHFHGVPATAAFINFFKKMLLLFFFSFFFFFACVVLVRSVARGSGNGAEYTHWRTFLIGVGYFFCFMRFKFLPSKKPESSTIVILSSSSRSDLYLWDVFSPFRPLPPSRMIFFFTFLILQDGRPDDILDCRAQGTRGYYPAWRGPLKSV